MNLRFLVVAAFSAAAVAGCAGSAAPNAELEQARAAVNRAEQNPNVMQLAPVPLADARQSLESADAAWKADQDVRRIEHLAYLARRKAELAEAQARIGAAEKTAELAGRQRTESIISARERELAQAQAQAQAAKERARTAEEIAAMEQARASQTEAQTQAELQKLQNELAELKPQLTDRGVVLTLQDVLFDTGKAQLKPGADRSLDKMADFLKQNPGHRVMIEGHTDSRGSDTYNQELSERRADAVKQEMVRRDVPGDTIETRGLGEGQPIASNNSSGGRQLNRRVEFIILGDQNARGG